ncbi:unnamed protein product [Plutella xylostella]|uniref:RNA-directed DNA polymerase n=1 Tax=Plutella xylostella TaxID=51655 RepID=A0A8S4G9T8_PLUXY|nr:unnamed protein product [Plutella xylostella]
MSAKRPTTRTRKKDDAGRSNEVLDVILNRLNAIEDRINTPSQPPTPVLPALDAPPSLPPPSPRPSTSRSELEQPRPGPSTLQGGASAADDVTDRIIGALSALSQVRSNHFYVSNFDPDVHDFDVWCSEIDRARILNRWDDNECLARVAGCLKGDARLWLSDWVTNERTWTNFKRDFKSLCPRSIDVANILFEVMCTSSNDFPTYSEYARRSLLRLNIVSSLSEDLKVAIVLRGITDPQIKAVATNAKLKSHELVEFLSVYTKPKIDNRINRDPVRSSKPNRGDFRKREAVKSDVTLKCFGCGTTGHKRADCFKRRKVEAPPSKPDPRPSSSRTPLICTYCKKSGHVVESCFVKQRSEESKGNRPSNVNFCRKLLTTENRDVMSAVIQGVPVDVLINSGSSISLISESVLKHFNCKKVPAYRMLRGIGSQEIECTSYVTTVVEFPEISLEVDFYIVARDCMNAPLLIGTDVLNRKGVTYIRNSDVQRLVRRDLDSTIEASPVCHVSVTGENTIKEDSVNTPLVGKERDQLMIIINRYASHFITGTATTTVTTGSMQIKLNSGATVYYRPYKLSLDEKIRVRAIISDLLSKGIIRESESEFASPIILVKKKDGSDRMCVDYRALNAITIKDRYPLPLIDDHIDRLGGSKYFSGIDMASGFHQILLSPDSIEKTAFVTPEGHYEYLKMPYGLANAPVVYQRIISKTLKPLIESGKVLTYIDDVLIPSMTVQEGLETLSEVLEILTKAGFSINLKNCTFLSTEVEYLGRLISQGQVRPSPRKIEALVKSPKPTNVKQVRQFLGLAGYFRRYISGYATKTAPIARLTRKGESFNWGSEQDSARDYIISCLTTEPVLAIFDPNLSTELHTDASTIGYGGVLLQEHEGKLKRVVGYFSKTTQGAESRYHSYELETLAIVKALQHFRHYLLGVTFKIVTDCNSLKLTERKKDLVPRVARWWVYMQDFQFSIEYRKGTLMSRADFLSRNPVVDVHHIRKPANWAQIAQSADAETQSQIDKLKEGQLDSSRYVVRNGVLYYKYSPVGEDSRLLCYIPKGHRLSLLRIFHDDHDHIGVEKTVDLILRHFWFPSLRQFTKKYVSHCLVCLSHKNVPRAPHQPIVSWTKPDVPFHTIHMDVLGPLPESRGFKYILVLVDAFSKYCLLYSLYRQDTDDLKRVFNNAIALFGTPSMIVCDRARMFESTSFQNWVTELGCTMHFITPEMHHENGQAERYCRTVLDMLRVEVNKNSADWSDVLWKIQLILNTTKHTTTQTSALHLLAGIEGTTPVIRALVRDVALENSNPNREATVTLTRQRAADLLSANQSRQDDYVNVRRKAPNTYKVGDMVFVKKTSQASGKLDAGTRGPYRVTKELPHHRYELQLVAGAYGKRTQAAAEYMILWRGEWTPETCAAFFSREYISVSPRGGFAAGRHHVAVGPVYVQDVSILVAWLRLCGCSGCFYPGRMASAVWLFRMYLSWSHGFAVWGGLSTGKHPLIQVWWIGTSLPAGKDDDEADEDVSPSGTAVLENNEDSQ